jgi:hypothetical protein
MAMIILAIISNFGVAHAQIGTGTASVDPPSGGFKIDGTLLTNSNIGDWLYGSGNGGFVLNNNGSPVNPGTTFWMQDNYNDGTSQDNVIDGSFKINSNPGSWKWVRGTISPAKNDMNNAFVHFTTDSNGNVWVIFAADRLDGGTNNSYMDFEFLQNKLTINSPTGASGTFSWVEPGKERKEGDFILSIAFSANPTFTLLRWNETSSSYDDTNVPLGNDYVYAAANTGATPISVPYGAFGSSNYTTNQFIEVAVNLTKLFSDVDPCNDMKINTIFVKTKASTGNSNINDFISPRQVPNISIGNANAGEDATVCLNQPYQLDGSAISSSGYSVYSVLWEKIDGDATILNPNILYPSVTITSGYATFRLTVVTKKGTSTCIATDEVTITADPTSVGGTVTGGTTICSGSTSGLLTLAGHTGTVVRWESSVSPFSTWTPISTTASTYTSGALTLTTQFRAVVQSGVCAPANSASTTVTVDPTSVGGTVAGSAAVCYGVNSTTLTLSGFTGSIIRWERSIDNFVTKTNITNTTATLIANNLIITTKYRAVLKSGTCPEISSAEATVTVNPLPIGTNKILTIDSGNTLNEIIAGNVNISGSTYTWQAADNTNIIGETTTTSTASSITDTLTNLTGSIQDVVYTIIPTSPLGCVGNSFTITVHVNPKLPTISINDQLNVNEGSTANFTVTLSNTYIYAVTFTVNTQNGTAIAPGDYMPIIGATYSIPAGATTVNIPVTINNDNIYETTVETYQVVLSNVNITTTNIAITTTDLIGDGSIVNTTTAPVVSIVATTQASEPNIDGLFTINLTNPVSVPTTVTYTITGTATNGADYQTITNTEVIPALSTSITIPVIIIDDVIIEPTETVIITLISTNTAVTIDPTKNIATVTISDNDGGPQNGIVINDVTVNEGAGNAVFTVTLTGNVQGGFTVDYATANGSAIAPGDYTSTSGTLTFAGNNNEFKTITVPIIDDSWIEPTENFFVNLSELSTDLIAINDAQGLGTIIDNDGSPLNGLVINDVTVNEGAGNAVFTVTLTGNVQGSFTVNYATAN